MLVLNRGEEELLIPFAKAYLVQIDLEQRVCECGSGRADDDQLTADAEERAEQQGSIRGG